MYDVIDEPSVKRCPRCAEEVRAEAARCRHCHSELIDPPVGELIRQWIRANPALTASLATFLYVVFQIYKSGEFEVNTTVELLRAGGLTSILLGVLLVQLPIELVLISLVCCWWLITVTPLAPADTTRSGARTRLAMNDPRTTPLVILGVLLVLSFYTSPWPFFLLTVLLAVVASTIALRRTNRGGPVGTRTRRVITVLMVAAFLILVQRPTTWAPSESITTRDQGTLAGYVISADERWTTILTPTWTGRLPAGENSVRRVPTDQVVDRKLCAFEFIEARLFDQVLRLRPVQLIDALNRGAMPQPLTPPCP